MQEKENIEELFKEAFKNYEEPVKPELWTKVSNAINTPPASVDISSGTSQSISTGTTGVFGNLAAYITGAAIVVGTVAGIYLYSSNQQTTPATNSNNEVVATEINKVENDINVAPNTTEEPLTIETDKPSSTQVADKVIEKTSIPVQKTETPAAENDKNSEKHNSTSVHVTRPVTEAVENHSQQNIQNNQPNELHTIDNKTSNSSESTNNSISSTQELNITISASTTSGVAPLTVDFMASFSLEKTEWNFGDGTIAGNDGKAQHTFDVPGDYIVKFKTTSPEGKLYTKSVIIEVLSNLNIANVPNVFTPNGDGKNDLFTFEAPHLIDFEVEILDQSGRKIHSWRKVDGGWNGRLNSGQEAREGTYFYIIFATGENNRHNTQQGTLKLMR